MTMLVTQVLKCHHRIYSALFPNDKGQYRWQIKSSFIKPLRKYDGKLVYAKAIQHRVIYYLPIACLQLCRSSLGLTCSFQALFGYYNEKHVWRDDFLLVGAKVHINQETQIRLGKSDGRTWRNFLINYLTGGICSHPH